MIDCIMTDIPQLSRSHITLGHSWRASKLGDLTGRLCYRAIKRDVVAIYEGMTESGALVPWVSALGEDSLKLEWKEGKRSYHFEVRPGEVTYWGESGKKKSQVHRDGVEILFRKYAAWLLNEESKTNE